MSPNRNWFSTYRFIECGVVLIRNNLQSKVIKIDTVELRMHDGTTVTLTKVQQI